MVRKPRIGVTPYFNYDTGEEYVPEGYFRAVEHLGGEFVIIHYNTDLSLIDDIVDTLDGIIFAGGPDVDPELYGADAEPDCGRINRVRDDLELKLFAAAGRRKLPVLGICRGIQLINVAMGGTLIQHIPGRYAGSLHQQTAKRLELWHDVTIIPGTPLASVYADQTKVRTNSFHHQAILSLAEGLEVNAVVDEGFVEAISGTGDQFILGVQWHPEISYNLDANSRKVFDLFRDAVAAFIAQE